VSREIFFDEDWGEKVGKVLFFLTLAAAVSTNLQLLLVRDIKLLSATERRRTAPVLIYGRQMHFKPQNLFYCFYQA
jgi:hypothetical protein